MCHQLSTVLETSLVLSVASRSFPSHAVLPCFKMWWKESRTRKELKMQNMRNECWRAITRSQSEAYRDSQAGWVQLMSTWAMGRKQKHQFFFFNVWVKNKSFSMGNLDTRASLTNVYDLLTQTPKLFKENCPAWRKFKFPPRLHKPHNWSQYLLCCSNLYYKQKCSLLTSFYFQNDKFIFMEWFRGKIRDHSVLMTGGHQKNSCEDKGGPLTVCLCSFILHLLICVWECVYVWEREKERVWEHV